MLTVVAAEELTVVETIAVEVRMMCWKGGGIVL
jgi:hypothetical protein